MPGNIDSIKGVLNSICSRRPALKRKMLKAMTNVLITTPSTRLYDIAVTNHEIEKCFIDVLTKYVKRNPASKNNLTNLCDSAIQLSDIILTSLNTKTSITRCIKHGYNTSFTNADTINDKIKTNLLGEENDTR